LADSKLTNHPHKRKLMVEFVKLLFSPFGAQALWFIIRAARFGLLALPTAIELAFRGRHYVSVAGRIAKTQPQLAVCEKQTRIRTVTHEAVAQFG
jgi:hypothetical protein